MQGSMNRHPLVTETNNFSNEMIANAVDSGVDSALNKR